MVRLIPPFLRGLIPSQEDSGQSPHSQAGDADEGSKVTHRRGAAEGDELEDGNDGSESLPGGFPEPSDEDGADLGDKLESVEITSNIATIASIDWGPPRLNPNLLEELGNSGRHLFDVLTGSKTATDPLDVDKLVKNVPKVYESDFSVYFDQMNKIYSEHQGIDMLLSAEFEPGGEEEGEEGEKTMESVSREYFEDEYEVSNNLIFNNQLDKIPDSIHFLEKQLKLINLQLRELVGTHLKHVGESFHCVEKLKKEYMGLNSNVSRVRGIFSNLNGIYSCPVEYEGFKSARSLGGSGNRCQLKRQASVDKPRDIDSGKVEDKEDGVVEEAPVDDNPPESKTLETLESINSISARDGLTAAQQLVLPSPRDRKEKLFELKYNNYYRLGDVLAFKRKVLHVMDQLRVLRGVACTPEYIQAIIDIKSMSVARIFAECISQCFSSNLNMFLLTNSVVMVVRDTILNLEKVAEAKFIDLCFYSINSAYCFNMGASASLGSGPGGFNRAGSHKSSSSTALGSGSGDGVLKGGDFGAEFENELRAISEKLEPVLTVLIIAGLVDGVLETLVNTQISPLDYGPGSVRVLSLQDELEVVAGGFKCSSLFMLQVLRLLSCVYLHNRAGHYMPSLERGSEIVEGMTLKIEACFSEGINRDYSKINETTQYLRNELNVPSTCGFVLFSSCYQSGARFDDLVPPTGPPGGTGRSGRSQDEITNININEKKEDGLKLFELYLKLFKVIENVLLKSLERLLNALALVAYTGTASGVNSPRDGGKDGKEPEFNIKAKMKELKAIEGIYSQFVAGAVDHFKVTHSIVLQLFNHELNLHHDSPSPATTLAGDQEVVLFKAKLDGLVAQFIATEMTKNVQLLFEDSLVEVHRSLSREDWAYWRKKGLVDREFNLVNSSFTFDDHLSLYFKIAHEYDSLATLTLSKAINLFAYFNTLVENELEKDLAIRKLCLILQALDYFSLLIPTKLEPYSSTTGSGYESSENEDDRMRVVGINAENCLLESRLLREKAFNLLSDYIFSQVKMHLINWVFKYYDPNAAVVSNSRRGSINDNVTSGTGSLTASSRDEDDRSRLSMSRNESFQSVSSGLGSVDQDEEEREVDLVIKMIEEIYLECSQVFQVDDLKALFADAFGKLVELARKQGLDFMSSDAFSDDCTRIITGLAHLKDIKLEVINLAHGLSSR